MNLKELSVDELNALSKGIGEELKARFAAERAQQELNRLIEDFQKTLNRSPGEDWIQPSGPLEAYQTGQIVSHNEQVWRSLKDGNTTEPGSVDWEAVEGSPEEPPAEETPEEPLPEEEETAPEEVELIPEEGDGA